MDNPTKHLYEQTAYSHHKGSVVSPVKVAASWSGGKDGCFACYKAMQQGFEVVSLLTFMSGEGKSNFHRLPSELLDAQSAMVGIPLVKRKTAKGTYEQEFKSALRQLKAAGVEGLVTGDIYEVSQHEEGWLERVCEEVGVKPVKPLWRCDTRQLLRDFIDQGFGATVVKVKAEVLGEEWLGREVNSQFFSDIVKLGNVDPCGERGEYHTCVTDGPLFSKSIRLVETKKTFQGGFGFLSVGRFEVCAKSV